MTPCKVVQLITLFILTDLNKHEFLLITEKASNHLPKFSPSGVLTLSKPRTFPSFSLNPFSSLSSSSSSITEPIHKESTQQPIVFNKEITYTLIEELNVPQFIGDLIQDLNLYNYLLSYPMKDPLQSLRSDQEIQNNQTKQILSIDLIANQYQSIKGNTNNNNNYELPRLYLFPSSQWSAAYFHINYHNVFKQELIQIKKLDRDHICQMKTNGTQQLKQQSDICMCSTDICSMINREKDKINTLKNNNSVLSSLNFGGNFESSELLSPYCQFSITIAIHLFHIGMKIFTINIQLIDLNDNQPNFAPFLKYEINFMEDDQIGTRHQLPLAIDLDMCLNSEITYRLVAVEHYEEDIFTRHHLINRFNSHDEILHNRQLSNSTNLFSLRLTETMDLKVLEIQLEHILDRENVEKYELYLLAIDDHYRLEEKRHTTTLPLIINIQDVNDCRPEFHLMGLNNSSSKLSEPLFIEISENVPSGQVVTKFQAFDKDSGNNAEIYYEMGQYTHSITKSFFSLDPTTGELIVKNILDREKIPFSNGLHRLTIKALDNGVPQRSSTLLVMLQLLDVNDNAPMIQLVEETYQDRQFSKLETENNMNQGNSKYLQSTIYNFITNEIKNNLITKLWQSVMKNKSMNSTLITSQLNNLSLHAKIIGSQPKETIVTFLIVNDPDLNENGTVTCNLEDQLVVYSEKYLKQNEYYAYYDNKVCMSLEPFELGSDKYHHQELYQQNNEDNNSRNSLSIIERRRISRKWESLPSNYSANHYTFQLKTEIFLDPDKISDLYLLIQCHDHGTPSLSTKQTIHIEILPKVYEEQDDLKFLYVKLLGDFIRNDVNCVYFNGIPVGTSLINQLKFDQQQISGERPKFIHPVLLHTEQFQAKSSLCLLLQKDIHVGQKLFTVIAKYDHENGENSKIVYELIKEIPEEHTFNIHPTSGIIQLYNTKMINQSIRKQLIIQASRIGTLYDYSKHLNHKIHLLINLTFIDINLSVLSVRNSQTVNNTIYLMKSENDILTKVYSNHTYTFYVEELLPPGSPVLGNTIIYCMSNNVYEVDKNSNQQCELKLNEIDTVLLPYEKNQ
ncbi:unnamed protein product [Heterobilharzia americana]|nr:unnamed protein product [Heterobilharzia americana]